MARSMRSIVELLFLSSGHVKKQWENIMLACFYRTNYYCIERGDCLRHSHVMIMSPSSS